MPAMSKEPSYFTESRAYLRALLDPATGEYVDVAGDPELEAEIVARCKAASAADPEWWRSEVPPDAAGIVESVGRQEIRRIAETN